MNVQGLMAVATLWQKRTSISKSMGLLPNLWLPCFVSIFAFAAIEGSQGTLALVLSAGFALSVVWTGLSTLLGYGLGQTNADVESSLSAVLLEGHPGGWALSSSSGDVSISRARRRGSCAG